MNNHDNYVHIPYDAMMPHNWENFITIAFGALFLGGVIYAGILFYKERDPAVILIMIGAAIASLAEPIVDILGMCIHHIQGQQFTLFTTFGRPIPIYVTLCYVFYFGAMVIVLVRQFQKGITLTQVWKWYLISIVIEFCFEPIPLRVGLWSYYGAQPFKVLLFPLWWPPVNALSIFVPAIMIYYLRPHLKGVSLLVLLFIVLSGDLIANVAVGWPIHSALHSGLGYAVTYPAAVLTLILCAVAIQIIGRGVERSSDQATEASLGTATPVTAVQ